MNAYRADLVVRVLTVTVSIMYFLAWGLTVVLLIAVPAVVLFGDADALRNFTLGVPATVVELEHVKLASSWGGTVGLKEARVDVIVPLSIVPAWFRAVTYAAAAGMCALTLLFLSHLRQLFQRVRQGVPFDAQNATRLRRLGELLLAGDLLFTAIGFWQSTTLLRTVHDPAMPLRSSFAPDLSVIFIALVLIALAEIFRRGAALEDEQSLVV